VDCRISALVFLPGYFLCHPISHRAAKKRDEVATADASCHLTPLSEGYCGPMIASPKQEGLFDAVLVAYLASHAPPAYPCGRIHRADLWLHEIKHDGFRVIARKDGDRVRITEAGRRALLEAKR
jgi:ATP-dependent DNA ligase